MVPQFGTHELTGKLPSQAGLARDEEPQQEDAFKKKWPKQARTLRGSFFFLFEPFCQDSDG